MLKGGRNITMSRYRYILCGVVLGTDKISDYRLIGGKHIKAPYKSSSGLRVQIPDDLVLEKWSCDNYSTTRDERTLDELGYDVMIWNGKKWVKHNELKGLNPHEFPFPMYGY